MKAEVNLRELIRAVHYLENVNRLDLKDIKLVLDGTTILPKESEIEDFRFTGLSNVDFAETHILSDYP